MPLVLSSIPPRLRGQVLEQRIFRGALMLALTGHDHSAAVEEAAELRQLAANGTAAAEDAARRAAASSQDTDWSDIARTAAIQALAAAVGASLLDVAVRSLQQGDAEHARFRNQTRAEIAQVA
jgi:hypothetical protein